MVSDHLVAEDNRAEIAAAVSRLPEAQRILIRMCVQDDAPRDFVAFSLGMTRKRADKEIAVGLLTLKAMLGVTL